MKMILRKLWVLLFVCACSPGIDTYVRQLAYPNVDMRVYAVEKLGESKHLDAVPHLIKALGDDKLRVRLAAIDALALLEDRRATDALLPFLENKRPAFVLATIEALGAIGDADAVDALGTLVTNEVPTLRLAAIDALGQIGSARALPVLMGHVEHESVQVRQFVALALGRIGDLQAIGVLVALLADPSDVVHRMAHYALDLVDEKWRDRPETQVAFLRFKNDLMAVDIVGNASALMRYGTLVGLQVIDPNWDKEDVRLHYEGFLNSEIQRERWVAAQVLGDLGDRRALNALVRTLDDGDRSVQKHAIHSLGKLDDPRAIPILRYVLNEGEIHMKGAAISALATLGDTLAVPSILAQLTPEILANKGSRHNGNIPFYAAVALGKLKATQGVPMLMQLADHANSGVRQHAVRALGIIGDRQASGCVLRRVTDRHNLVRSAAVKASAQLGILAAVDPLVQMLGSGSVDDDKLVAALDQLDRHWKDRPLANAHIQQLISRFKTGTRFEQRAVITTLSHIGGTRAKTVLLQVLKQRDLDLVANAHAYYIKANTPYALPALLQALEGYGTEQMVQTYLASGHTVLTQAARSWAHTHGMALVTLPEGSPDAENDG